MDCFDRPGQQALDNLASPSQCLISCLPCRFDSYEEDSEGVTVRFVGDSPGPVRAKVLIGADGYFSAVREQCLADGPPDFAVRT